jgi:hypothetical protein
VVIYVTNKEQPVNLFLNIKIMDKELLLEKYIKQSVRKALKEQEAQQQKAEKAMYLVYRFPGLKKIMEDLMSPAFGRYINGINIVSPKPTTFQVDLINGQDFSIKYLGKDKFNVKVAGKKYNPINLDELERASQSISDLLELNYAPAEGKEQPSTPGGDEFGSTPASPTPPPPGTSASELGPELAVANTEPTPPAANPELTPGGTLSPEKPLPPEEENPPIK